MTPTATFYSRYGKRLFDLVVSAAALVLLAPVFVLVAIVVRCCLGAPILFRQRRVGLNDRPFDVVKFRSMNNACGPDGALLPDTVRLTAVGRWLRASSLDELPQLWNVLCGEMSLVGPRPLYEKYLPHYTPRERLRHSLRPGITGLAQVSGRNILGWNERLELDARYAERITFFFDLALLAKTVLRVVKRSGVVVQGVKDLDVERAEVALQRPIPSVMA